MNKTIITLLLAAAATSTVWAQDRIYRCGNEYTNNAQQAKERGCKQVEGGNVTIVQGSRPAGGAAASAAPAAGGAATASPPSAPRVSNNDSTKVQTLEIFLFHELLALIIFHKSL